MWRPIPGSGMVRVEVARGKAIPQHVKVEEYAHDIGMALEAENTPDDFDKAGLLELAQVSEKRAEQYKKSGQLDMANEWTGRAARLKVAAMNKGDST